MFAVLPLFATIAGGQPPGAEIQRESPGERTGEGNQQAQKNGLDARQPSALETELKKTQEKAQLAQQNADLATSQRSALETELKKAQERAQLAEKSVDLAASQRRALEAELAKAEERAQLAEKSADLAAGQRSALEAELKKAQEKAQAVQQNADLAASQRSALEAELKKAQEKAQAAQQSADLRESRWSALEAELKKAQEKAQLAQQIADLIAAQPHAEQRRLSNEEPPEKSADISANQPKSGPAQRPNAGMKPEQAASTQPLDSSVESAQEPVKLAGINQSQAAIPLPTPSIAASVQSTSPAAQTDRSFKASVEEQSLKEFVLEYIRTVASNDVSKQTGLFEHRVNYYGEGLLSLPSVQTSLERYHREWPIRNWEPQGEPEFPKILHSTNPKLYEVLQPFTWAVSDGSRHEQGGATLYVRIWKNDKGEFHIVHVEQRNPIPNLRITDKP